MSSKSIIEKSFLFVRLLALISFSAYAQEPNSASDWVALTSQEKPVCSTQMPCRIQNGSILSSIEFNPESFLFDGEPKQKLDLLKIKDISSTQPEPQVFRLEDMNYLSEKEYYQLFQIRIRPTGETDLALRAYNSANEGPVYYYFLFDRQKNAFVISQGALPKLKFDPKTRRYLTEIQSAPFVLDTKLQFRPPVRKK